MHTSLNVGMIWTPWLTRNECVFNNTSCQKNYRISSQNKSVGVGKANDQISANYKVQWSLNPILAYKNHEYWAKKSMISNLLKDNVYVGFVEGSWKITNVGSIIDVGGFILDQQGRVKYIFSGPVTNYIGWEMKSRTLHFVCKALQEKVSIDIATDSKLLYDFVQRSRAFPS